MLIVARKNLFSERTRLAISVGGIALAVFLIGVLLSLYRGWENKVGGFVEDSNVDVWIANEGAKDFLAAASLLPYDPSLGVDPCQQQIQAALQDPNRRSQAQKFPVQDIRECRPLIVRQMEGLKVEIQSGGEEKILKKMNLQFVGYDAGTQLGGPLRIVEGSTDAPKDNEVVVDEALGKRYGVQVGDTLKAGGRDWNVIAKSGGGDFVAAQTVFVSLDAAADALGFNDAKKTTFYVIRLKDGIDAKAFADGVDIPGVHALDRSAFASNTKDRILSNVLPILAVVLLLAFIVGLSVAGLTIYTATVEKSREYGILKAVGFRNSYLYRAVLEQSIVTGFLGFVIGIGLMLIIGPFAADVVPQFVIFTRWQDVLAVAGATLVMAGVAAYIPVRRLASIDPVAVFKA
ncbi:MAG: ABC transporter permease [Chloroflexi bacterium]|nr:MAG: ABC transporter permease [Chloroflexota bacterium]